MPRHCSRNVLDVESAEPLIERLCVRVGHDVHSGVTEPSCFVQKSLDDGPPDTEALNARVHPNVFKPSGVLVRFEHASRLDSAAAFSHDGMMPVQVLGEKPQLVSPRL